MFIPGAPGSQKSEYCKRIAKRYDGFVHLSMGELLRQEQERRVDDDKFQAVLNGMNYGDLLPTVHPRYYDKTSLHIIYNIGLDGRVV